MASKSFSSFIDHRLGGIVYFDELGVAVGIGTVEPTSAFCPESQAGHLPLSIGWTLAIGDDGLQTQVGFPAWNGVA